MEFLGALIGAGIVAISPLVPVLRPVAKAAVKGGLAVADASKGAAAVAAHQWSQVVSEASTEARETGESVAADDVAADVEDSGAGVVAEPTSESGEEDVAPAEAKDVEASAETEAAEDSAGTDDAPDSVGDTQAIESSAKSDTAHGDDLTQIKGIGPKVAAWLNEAGIDTFDELAMADTQHIKQQLMNESRTYRAVDPGAWADEARSLAAARA